MAKGISRHNVRPANKANSKDEKLRKELISSLLTKCTSYGDVTDDDLREILSLIDSIDQIEQPMAAIVPNIERNEENFTKFIRFCSENGVDTSSIEILKREDGEYGVKAVKDIKQDDIIVQIPKNLILTVSEYMRNLQESRHKSESDRSFSEFVSTDPILSGMPSVVLALILMKESTDAESFWQPYINILPSMYRTPLYFTRDEFTQMKCTSIYQESARTLRSIARQYSYFWTQMQSSRSPASRISFRKQFTFQFYRWAVSTIMTRQNVIPAFCIDEDPRASALSSHALIPLWDMFNHRNGKLSTDFESERNCLICYSMSDFKKDNEIFIHYGDRANRDFFLHNGFVDDSNDLDFVNLRLGISKGDPLAPLKMRLCEKLRVPAAGVFFLAKKHSSRDSTLVAFLRLFHMTQDELQSWLLNDAEDLIDVFTSDDVRLSHLDDLVAKFVAIRASLLVKSYPSQEEISQITNENIRRMIRIDLSVFTSYLQ